jgi:hypothetical protein
MSEEEWRGLRTQLSAEPPPGLGELSGEQIAHLSEAIRAARHRQAEALEQAGQQAFAYVPRLLRGPIRKIIR